MTDMKYSFVIPTYNKIRLLQQTLEALNRQEGVSGERYEVIVVDDGSSEDVFKHIRGIATNYKLSYTYLQRTSASCRSRSRNYGIRMARGSHVVFIDDDIIVTPYYLEELDRYYSRDSNLVVIGTRMDCQHEFPTGTSFDRLKQSIQTTNRYEIRHIALNHLSFNLPLHRYPWLMAYTCNIAAPKEMVQQVGGFDENFIHWGHEDIELGYRLHCAGARFAFNPRLEAIHQYHPKSPEGKDNFDYFVKKCQKVFDHISPAQLLSVFGISPNRNSRMQLQKNRDVDIATFLNYQGPVTQQKVLNFKDETKLETLKEKILQYARTEGCHLTINDFVETTCLDCWVQLMEFPHAPVYYYPRSHTLGPKEFFKTYCKIIATEPTQFSIFNKKKFRNGGNLKNEKYKYPSHRHLQ